MAWQQPDGRLPLPEHRFSSYRLAYQRVLPEAQALGERVPQRFTVSAGTVCSAVFPRQTKLAELRGEVIDSLPKHDMREFDALEERTQALAHADSQFRMSLKKHPSLASQLANMRALRDYLRAECEQLSRRGCLSAEPVRALRFSSGHRRTVSDTYTLCTFLINHGSVLAEHSRLTVDRLNQIEIEAANLEITLLQESSRKTQREVASLIRRQMFTLVFASIDNVTHAVRSLRKPRPEEYVPQVYAGRGKRNDLKPRSDAVQVSEVVPETGS